MSPGPDGTKAKETGERLNLLVIVGSWRVREDECDKYFAPIHGFSVTIIRGLSCRRRPLLYSAKPQQHSIFGERHKQRDRQQGGHCDGNEIKKNRRSFEDYSQQRLFTSQSRLRRTILPRST